DHNDLRAEAHWVTRSEVNVQPPAKTETGHHGDDEPIEHPRTRPAGPRHAFGIVNRNRPDRCLGPEWRLAGVHQDLPPAPTWSSHAHAHETVADRQLLINELIVHLEDPAMIAALAGPDVPAHLPLAGHPDRPDRYRDRVGG